MLKNFLLHRLLVSFAIVAGTIALPYFSFAQEQSSVDPGANKYILSPSIYFRDESKSLDSSSRTRVWIWEINFGYHFENGLYAGAIYSHEQENVRAQNFPIDDINTNYEYVRSSYGLAIGYIYYAYYARLNYLQTEWQIDENNQSVKFDGGWGAQVDLGMIISIFDRFLVGPKISYKHFMYSHEDGSNGRVKLDNELEKNSWDPSFAIWWEF